MRPAGVVAVVAAGATVALIALRPPAPSRAAGAASRRREGLALRALKGEAAWPRQEFFYWTDEGDLAALRYDRWKIVFMEQRAHGLDVWEEPLVTLRLPKLFCLRSDPFELADHQAADDERWRVERIFALVPAQAFVARHLQTYRDFPPRQKPGSFGLEQVLQRLQESGAGAR
jgi:arylsulfatase